MWVEVWVKRVRKPAFLVFLWGTQAEGFTASGMVFAAPGILPWLWRALRVVAPLT